MPLPEWQPFLRPPGHPCCWLLVRLYTYRSKPRITLMKVKGCQSHFSFTWHDALIVEKLQIALRIDSRFSEHQQQHAFANATAPKSNLDRLSAGISVTRKVDTRLKVDPLQALPQTHLSGMWSAVPLLGPTISAACMAMDGKDAKKTLRRIKQGSPCDKPVMLRAISNDLKTNNYPSTETVDEQCRMYVDAAKLRAAVI